jgi:hypothetical protein
VAKPRDLSSSSRPRGPIGPLLLLTEGKHGKAASEEGDRDTRQALRVRDGRQAEQLIAASSDQIRTNLTEELQSIARRYWEQSRDSERPRANWYRTKVGRIEKEAENLLKLLREPRGTARRTSQAATIPGPMPSWRSSRPGGPKAPARGSPMRFCSTPARSGRTRSLRR